MIQVEYDFLWGLKLLKKLDFSAPLVNEGENCWNRCNQQDGDCDWCGVEGKCCRLDWIGASCDGSEGAFGKHTCVSKGK